MKSGSLLKKALEMRAAIDEIELALSSVNGFSDQIALWEGAAADLFVKVEIPVGIIRQMGAAYANLNHIINSEEYAPKALTSNK